MAKDPQLERHKQWLGYLQPQGLVVAPAALVDCQAWLSESVLEEQRSLQARFVDKPVSTDEFRPGLTLRELCIEVLGWAEADLEPGSRTGIESVLAEYHETLRPDYAVRDLEPADPTKPWVLLIQVLPHGSDPDQPPADQGERHWRASYHARFERLLRESGVPAGVLFFGTGLRLVHAPKGEASGHVTFPFAAMSEVGGRPILAALLLLLGHDRLFVLGREQRLPALLERSRRYQNQVSTALAEQVLAGLHALLRGFEEAHAHSSEALLRDWLASSERRDEIYGGLLTVMLRLIFLLYAEDRGLLASDEAWQEGYSVLALYERLRGDADRFPDTMEHRYGAWAQLLATFRLVFDGCRHGRLSLPPRHGYLFHPDGGEGVNYQFLENRPYGVARQVGELVEPPRVSDKTVWDVLRNLMVLDGERISYRTLNVEQIGSVYETMMGFRIERTRGPSVAVKPQKPHGASSFIELAELVAERPASRGKWLKDRADCKPSDKALDALKSAATPEEIAQALGRKVSPLTPSVLPPNTFVLQPSDARRKSGSHYTPPQLTQPIVATTLRPILEQLGESPRPEQILELKVCDPAMGSGAFLVEACRQLGAALVRAWLHHPGRKPPIPPDEDELLFAKRLVATRCLYGVDKNPFAVALAKLSLWLETFAKEHAFTFVDHALRCGDSLVGLSKAQISAFHWDERGVGAFVEAPVKKKLKEVEAARAKIRNADESTRESTLRRWLREADDALDELRLIGDLVVAAYFSADKDRAREARRKDLAGKVETWLRARGEASALKDELRGEVAALRNGAQGLSPFHWEIEFPEVFARGGFDAFVGNPPFAGKNTIADGNRAGFLDWLKLLHEDSHGNADLVAHFFRRAFVLLRPGGTFGLLATKTIRQGDTRTTGLRWICQHGGSIYSAERRIKWPGLAAVVVSVVHVAKGELRGPRVLDGRPVEQITAFLFHDGGHEDPVPLAANASRSFIGSYVLGVDGFTFDDTNEDATPIAEMERLIAQNPKNRERIFPYLGGEEVNNSPTHAHRRWVINFEEMDEETATHGWPDLMQIVETKVKPKRLTDNRESYRRYWWQYAEKRGELTAAIRGMDRVLVISRIGNAFAFVLLPNQHVFNEKCVVFPYSRFAPFCALQSRVHEAWTRFFSTTLKDDLQYTPSRCFETFPFVMAFDHDSRLEAAGKAYHEFRAALMANAELRQQLIPSAPGPEGLTKTYNRFHDPEERSPGILQLRELHAAMDRAVLDAYGWTDLHPTHEFLLDWDDEDDDDDDPTPTRRRRRPWRYRWPDEFRDEVLMRLLRLNHDRAEEEKRLSVPAQAARAPGPNRSPRRRGDPTPDLPGMGEQT